MTRFIALLIAVASTPAVADEKIDFASQIQPILVNRCAKCHGAEKQLGDLALHDAAALAAAEDNGLLVPEDAEISEVYTRLILPADDKLLMPKGGDPLPAEEIELIEKWINQSTTFTNLASAEPVMPDDTGQPDLPPLPPVEAATAEAIAAVEELGALVMPLYAGSNELRVSFPSGADQVNDETVKVIAGLAPALVELDLHGSSITDACAAELATLVHLRKLHLENTQIGDPTVTAVAGLAGLDYLNVYNTKATDASIARLAGNKRLARLYVWQTAVTFAAAKQLEEQIPGLEVNLGWNHPDVVRERLTSELERVTKQAAEADEQQAAAQRMLDEAKAQKDAAVARQQEIEKELEALNNPGGET